MIIAGGGKPFGYTNVCVICGEAFTSYSNSPNECLCPECRERIVKLLYGESKCVECKGGYCEEDCGVEE